MSRSSKSLICKLTAWAMCLVLAVGFSLPVQAASTIDRQKTGSLTIEPTYGGAVQSGGVFRLYYVATLGQGPALGYDLRESFAESGVDFSRVKTAEQVLAAASTLMGFVSNVPTEEVITHDRATGGDTVDGLALGVYLVENVSIPAPYLTASAFLVFIPMTGEQGTSWQYSFTAQPKLGYRSDPPPDPEYTSVSVTKVWNDAGYEANRPASISVSLFRNGESYNTVTLSTGNWSYTWSGLDVDYVWTVREVEVPAGYTSSITSTGSSYVITNTLEGGEEPTTTPEEEVDITDPLGPGEEPTAPVTGPDEEVEIEIPLAGMVQWPVPVLSACGLVFITGGVTTGRKKKNDEEDQ